MAVCGRCLICGWKFNGDYSPDVAARWTCVADACSSGLERREHGICTACHDILTVADLEGPVSDLLELVRSRADRAPR